MCIGTDHYVFPEDCPEKESDVVRTVEEENLFTVAFPDIVQLFHKETAEAKDNKLKSMSLSMHRSLKCSKQHTLSQFEACQAVECR